ncbi:PQQ-binding-like beta-propeller repeat protein [Streptomyces rectiverticillatus]|uniref:outer membrane protein assembly factor BamB family protein n=1 Tax=Streptomyces rectiverticillatus TaxID=173860 RepID=UPI0015C3B6F1|nr:PQQ-binding-like beta-propeller repeat protein [Streptomyces rectiverticillatus]
MPPVPERPGRKGLIALAVAVGLVLVVALGAGVWMLLPGGGGTKDGSGKGGSGGSRATVSWSLPYTRSGLEHPRMIRGVWFTDKTVVKALPDRLVGLDPKTGGQRWEAPTPGSGSVLCQASADSTAGIAVLARGSGKACHTFYAVDLTSGKTLWEHSTDSDEWAPSDGPRIARSGDVVVVSADDHVTTAFRVSDGKQLWKDDDKGLYEGAEAKDTCRGEGYTGGKQLLRIQHCLLGGNDPGTYLAAVDPATGHAKWKYRLGEYGRQGQVLATSPIVVDDPDRPYEGRMRVSVLDDDGKLRTRLEGTPKRRFGLTRGDGGAPAADVRIAGDKLVMAMDRDEKDSDDNNQLTAWSLTTGKRLWDQRATGYLQTYHLVATSDTDAVLAYSAGNIHDPATLVRFDPATGSRKTVRTYRPTPTKAWIGSDPYPMAHGKSLYLSAGYVSESKGAEPERRQKSLIALPGTDN